MIMKSYSKSAFALFLIFLFSFNSNGQCPTFACFPTGPISSSTPSLISGPTNFTLNTINLNTNDRNTDPTYNDYSCFINTILNTGASYNFTSTNNGNINEQFFLWVDLDNNGSFDNATELLYTGDYGFSGTVNGSINIPVNGITKDTYLRLRIKTDAPGLNADNPCQNPRYGQIEDYAVWIEDDLTAPPVADFEANQTSTCNGIIEFTDNSSNVPTSWLWSFGDGNTSNQQNPTHTYANPGTYNVSLVATNTHGTNSITKNNYITYTDNSPVNASCYPGTASNAGLGFDAGIFNFSLNTINNSTNGDIDGYQDYSCNQQTTLFESTPYNVSITTGSNFTELVKIFVDLNGDGTFQAGEELYSSSALGNHSGNLTIPNTALKDSLLRLRVTADYIGSSAPTACSTPEYSQVEDYAITVDQNLNPPVSDFNADKVLTCDGEIKFTDLTVNGPTSWSWDFGDGLTSSSQNPTHIYINPGVYTVKLVATNANGTDSTIKTNFIEYHDTIPTSTNCTPTTNNYCCGYGISNFTFNTINNSSQDGFAGYEDFTCELRTRVIEGQQYNVSITTSSAFNQSTKIWIDYDDNGIFTDSSEIVFTSNGTQNPAGNIIIGSNAVFNTPLRMRVISDYDASNFTSCFNITHGQAEDYTIIIEPNNIPPIADFTASTTITCDSIVSFTNASLNSPNDYHWDFGDGTIDSTENPVHSYQSPGVYTVTLIVSNESGADTLTRTDYINYQPSPIASCVPTTINYCCNTGIQKFVLNDIDNTSDDAATPYEDFSCLYFTTLKAGEQHPVSITTGNIISEHVIIWIDLNNDGEFDNDLEQVYSSTTLQNHTGEIDIPRDAIYDTTLRMRVTSERSSSPIPSACSNLFNGQHEDYSIILTEPDSIIESINNDIFDEVKLYPNPANNFVMISSEHKVDEVKIYNSIGKEVIAEINPSEKINVERLTSGLYTIQLFIENKTITKKLLINEK